MKCQQISVWLNRLPNHRRKGLLLLVMLLAALLLTLQAGWAYYGLRKKRHEKQARYTERWVLLSAAIDAEAARLEGLSEPMSASDSMTYNWLLNSCRILEE